MANQISSDTVDLFDSTARKPMDHIDQLIQQGRYLRGEIFHEAVTSTLRKGSRVLDYGCGRGRISRMIAESGFRVDAMDPSQESLKDAKAHGERCTGLMFSLLTDSGEILNNEEYDGIVCSSVIEFVDDVPFLLRNFFKALKEKGVLFISFTNKTSLWRKYARMRFGSTGKHFTLQRHEWTPENFSQSLAEAGFDKVKVKQYFEPPYVKIPVVSRLISSRYIGSLGFAVARRNGNV